MKWNEVTPYSKLLSVVFVIVFSILGFYLGMEYQKAISDSIADTSGISVPAHKTSDQPSTIDTSTWQTYKNEKHGFEIKYPIDWQKFVSGGEESLLNIEKRFLSALYENPGSMSGYCKIVFYSVEKRAGETIKDWLYRDAIETGNSTSSNDTPFVIDSRTGLRGATEENGVVNYVFLPLSNINVLSISLYCGDDVQKKGELEFDRILSTLKFTQ